MAQTTNISLAAQFAGNANEKGWKGKKLHRERLNFYENEFTTLTGFGTDGTSDLEAWKHFCGTLGINVTGLNSIKKCKAALKGIYVNIIQYLEHLRSGSRQPAHSFTSKRKFIEYTMNGRVFPKAVAKRNRFVKELLEEIF